MKLRLSVILSILLTHNLFANDDLITLKGLNVATPYAEVESILTKRGYECSFPGTVGDFRMHYIKCSTSDYKSIDISYYTNVFKGLDGESTEVLTVWDIGINCDSLNACNRGWKLVELLERKYKLIKMTETDINTYNHNRNSYARRTRRIPYIDLDNLNSGHEYYRNPSNNDVLIYRPNSEYYVILPYKYESDKLKLMKKKKLVEDTFDID